jgi:hypothetical protein
MTSGIVADISIQRREIVYSVENEENSEAIDKKADYI